MKNLKKLLLLFMGIVAVSMSLTSCNSDSTDYSIDQVTQKQYQSTMAGAYIGKTSFMQVANYNKLDTIATETLTWTVRNDSTFTIHNFPVNRLDSAINVPSGQISSEATQLRELRAAISKAGTQDLKCFYWIPGTNWISTSGYQFFVNPMYFAQNLTYNGETHKVYFVFQLNYYIGQYVATSHKFQFDMVLSSICIDKEPTDYIPSFPSNYFRQILVSCR